MAALFWWCVLLLELLISSTLMTVAGLHGSLAQHLLVLVLILALLKCSLIGVSFLLATARGGHAGQRWDLRFLLPALLTECVRFSLAEWRMCIEPMRPRREPAPPQPGSPPRPVLLIHGLACNRGVWSSMIARLQAAGFGPIRALNLEPMFASIDSHCPAVVRELQDLRRQTGAPVTIIAHSMGGLVALATLRFLPSELVRQIVTIATPHYGTALPLCQCRPALRQLRAGSDWLRALHAAPRAAELSLSCIYSLEDNLVVPASSAALAGARCEALRGLGHLGMLQSRPVAERVLQALRT